METINARNAQQALPRGIHLLHQYGVREETRAGTVLRYPGPVVTVLTRPCERVVFYDWRDANPFFHIVEAAWMLAGRDDLAQLTPYVKRMAEFSDDGGATQPGAYGKRWRSHWQRDQLDWVVGRLRANSSDRRVVIQMWDPKVDEPAADANGADVPCNISMLPWVMDGALHLSVFNRSHDIVWGLYGANAVHFSFVLEYLAGRIGLKSGTMTTFSNNFHAYLSALPKDIPIAATARDAWIQDPYCANVAPYGMFTQWGEDIFTEKQREVFMRQDLNTFFEHGPVETLQTARWPWLRQVLAPMALAHARYKGPSLGRYPGAQSLVSTVAAPDWRLAAQQWLQRRQHAAQARTTAR